MCGQVTVLLGDAWLLVARSVILMTGSPSNLTSLDQELKYSLPVFLELMIPFLAAHPASVPEVFERSDLFLMLTVLPPILTVPVPLSVSLANPKLG